MLDDKIVKAHCSEFWGLELKVYKFSSLRHNLGQVESILSCRLVEGWLQSTSGTGKSTFECIHIFFLLCVYWQTTECYNALNYNNYYHYQNEITRCVRKKQIPMIVSMIKVKVISQYHSLKLFYQRSSKCMFEVYIFHSSKVIDKITIWRHTEGQTTRQTERTKTILRCTF